MHNHFTNRETFLKFLQDEKDEMERHKWIKSEKIGYDVGQDAIIEWINKHAASYRTWWIENHKIH